jgi:hypothetical protein
LSEQRGKPEVAPPEEEWVEESVDASDEEWTEEQVWVEDEATPGATGGAKSKPKQTPAYMTWLSGLVGLAIGLLAFRSCNPQ